MKYEPHPYQEHATEHIIQNPGCGLFLEMGLGKTVATLTAIDILKNELFEVSKVLVIAPKRVAEETWTTECAKWDHLKHLKISQVLGDESKRKKALKEKADIYIINRENVVWLIAQYGTSFPFDFLVIDELSSFKSPKAARFKALRMIRPRVERVVGLTGTPAPNGYLDLWSQLYLLDQGKRLGETFTGYRAKHFKKENEYNGSRKYICWDGVQERIFEKISDICISMKAADWLTLPSRINRTIELHLSPKVKELYDEFEKKAVLEFLEQEDKVITAVNAGALTNKLLQFANGAVYNEDKTYVEVHDKKLEALEEIIEAANGKPVFVAYAYQHDKDRIHKYLKTKGYKPEDLKGPDEIRRWNNGEIEILVAHPASAGHGLNLQAGGNIIVWFGLTWSLELYQQFNARLDRQGQLESVIIHHLAVAGTMDFDVMQSIADKAGGQEALLQAVKARVDKYRRFLKTNQNNRTTAAA